jgi:excisionase family DNA binding protein
MRSIHPGVTGRGDNQFEPLAVSPRQACVLLGVGITRLYELIGNGELQSYRDGRARRITTESIRRRVARLLAAASPSPRRRGRPRKIPVTQEHPSHGP